MDFARLRRKPIEEATGSSACIASARAPTGPLRAPSSRNQCAHERPGTLAAVAASCAVTEKKRGPQASPCYVPAHDCITASPVSKGVELP